MCIGWLSAQGKTTLTVNICALGVLSGQGKTTFTVYICVSGVVSGRGKTTLTLYFTSFKDYVKTNDNFALFWYKIIFLANFVRLLLDHPGMVLGSSEGPGIPLQIIKIGPGTPNKMINKNGKKTQKLETTSLICWISLINYY